MEKDIYKVIDFAENTSSELERKLNAYAKEGYMIATSEIKMSKGYLAGFVILHLIDEVQINNEVHAIGFNITSKEE